MFELTCRPIDQWPRELTPSWRQKRAPFRADYGTTMQDLERELKMVRAKGAVLLMAYREQDLRIDGKPRAGASPQHPGVILCFNDRTGPKRFPCDAFDKWTANLRAIALALEALRKVDRYGVTQHGEQYRGWSALPPPSAGMTPAEAMAQLRRVIGSRADVLPLNDAIREAEMASHPDAGGNADDFKRVQQARAVLLKNS